MRHLMKFGSLFAAVCLAPPTDLGSTTQPVVPDAESTLPKIVASDPATALHRENIQGSAPFTPQGALLAPEDHHAGVAEADQGMFKSGCGNKLSGADQYDNAPAGMKQLDVDKGGSGSFDGNVGAIQL